MTGFGDKVLVQIGDVLRAFAQENGMLVARHGDGEEFAALMILPQSPRKTASMLLPSGSSANAA
jgi:GGDEF domain-containing protein